MPVFTPIHVLKRSDDSTISNPVYIAGIVVVGVIALGVGLWLSLRVYRKRAMRKRQENMGAAFFSVKGLVPEGDPEKMDGSLQRSMTQSKGFSRNNLDASIILPEKALSRPGGAATREEIINYHAQSGALPKPFSFALSGGAPSPRTSMLDPGPRASFMSSATSKRFSVMSSVSSVGSSTSGSLRKVRQVFDPVLPDELLVSLGDQLTVVQSFDDGWCVVGRESEFAGLVQSAKSLFGKPSQAQQGSDVELGVVPAWCFLKPVKGLRAERPVRSSSLGITVQMDGPGFSSRNELTSWSNF
ncbi:unnamed protein product [Cyclocybe aegerita]|uniref:SH3 domain-containing protein n=1 Tax=Cyclocybe aegerita TaxID=1973307 RepID=A0A8S0WER4_CYCAE|nr:unnamed protein product [Cyclocybe aegerita]